MKLTAEDLAFAEQYDANKYWHPSVSADTALFRALDSAENAQKKYPQRKLELLLVKRGNHPYKAGRSQVASAKKTKASTHVQHAS